MKKIDDLPNAFPHRQGKYTLTNDSENLKTNLENIGAYVTGDNFPLKVSLNNHSYIINDNGMSMYVYGSDAQYWLATPCSKNY